MQASVDVAVKTTANIKSFDFALNIFNEIAKTNI